MVKRLLDIITALVALVIALPLFIMIALCIKIESPGPVFFMQTRVGKSGKPFKMFKFRKFPHNAAKGPAVTLVNDPRMTRTGKKLERFKLDELPQFINVLLGTMSIVGPRPETPNFVKHYAKKDYRVLDVLPGIFGINQLIYRREADLFPPGRDPEEFYIRELMPQKIKNDIAYIEKASIARDTYILVRCIFRVFVEPFVSKFKRIKNTLFAAV